MNAAIQAVLEAPNRLEAVRRTGLLDVPREEPFDRLTRLAARLTSAPVTFVSLVDERRDFYPSCYGFPEPLASARELTGTTFCHYAIAADGPLVIPDTRADPVYRDVPTVESLGVAAYLGIPLVTQSGETIGSFCAIDFVPHAWTPLDIEVLRELAASTLREIELRQAAREARDAHAAAEAAIRARDEMLAVVSHDLRNPLHTIISATVTMLELPLEEEQRTRFLQGIRRSGGAMDRLIQDLLDMSRLEAGRLTLAPEPASVGAMVRDACDLLTPSAEQKGIQLNCGTADMVPPVCADADRVSQVLSNLIGNAIKFTPAGGRVTVWAEWEDDAAVLSVRDTGPGIAPEVVPHIFERFWQPGSAREGAGLGLAIAKGIVDAHGGRIWVDSSVGIGTTFYFTLPLATAAKCDGAPPR